MSMGSRRMTRKGEEVVLFQAWGPAWLWEHLAEIAAAEDRTISAQLIRVIREAIK